MNGYEMQKSTDFHSAMHIPEKIYSQILLLMPIPSVDLLIEDEIGKILLLKRANEPVKGQWWLPGGRVHFLETREQAAARKLKEECGLEFFQMKEMGTDDFFFDMPDDANPRHCISTLFHIVVRNQADVILDSQSDDSDWRKPDEWLSESLHFLVKQWIATVKNYQAKR